MPEAPGHRPPVRIVETSPAAEGRSSASGSMSPASLNRIPLVPVGGTLEGNTGAYKGRFL